MTILVLGEPSTAREIEHALTAMSDWSVMVEQSPEAAGAAISEGRADLALMSIRGALPSDVRRARDLWQRWQTPIVYVLGTRWEEAWERLRDTRPLGWIAEPFDAEELRVTVDIAAHKATEDRRLRQELRRTHDCAALMAAESAALAEQLARIGNLAGAQARRERAERATPPSDVLAPLTPRERQIVEAIRQGGRVSSISGELGIRAATVRNHLSAAFRKLGVRSQGQLIALLRASQ